MQVDGITVGRIETPTTPAQVADLLAEADRSGQAVIPFGGGTKLALGNPPLRADIGLSMLGLKDVLHYEPTDLTLSVGAGARFADVQAVLAERGQELPIEAPDDAEATIGGLIATAVAGPRRLGSGTLRDLLIGISVAYPSGIVAKAGGLVVKNVTGFDLMRLHHGGLGTLGVILSANFKIWPRPRAEATVWSVFPAASGAISAAQQLRGTRVQPTAMEIKAADGGWRLAVRLMGRDATVAMLAAEVAGIVGGQCVTLSGAESIAFWRDLVAGESLRTVGDKARVRAGVKPSGTLALLQGLQMASERSSSSVSDWAISPGLGTVTMTLESGSLASFQRDALALADNVTVFSAPAAWKAGLDVWGRAAEPVGVMQAMKHEFDPNNVLNPGRFAGHL